MRAFSLFSLLTSLSLAASPGCSKKTPEEAFSCENLQQRALRCEQDTLDVIKRRMKAGAPDGSTAEVDRQFAMLERRFRERLKGGGTRKQCEKFSTPAEAERAEKMKACYARSGCAFFADCMLELDK